jgi:hypothetical protein
MARRSFSSSGGRLFLVELGLVGKLLALFELSQYARWSPEWLD